jgi:hypothetical protein
MGPDDSQPDLEGQLQLRLAVETWRRAGIATLELWFKNTREPAIVVHRNRGSGKAPARRVSGTTDRQGSHRDRPRRAAILAPEGLNDATVVTVHTS